MRNEGASVAVKTDWREAGNFMKGRVLTFMVLWKF